MNGAADFDERYAFRGRDVFEGAASALGLDRLRPTATAGRRAPDIPR